MTSLVAKCADGRNMLASSSNAIAPDGNATQPAASLTFSAFASVFRLFFVGAVASCDLRLLGSLRSIFWIKTARLTG
jgi:hypothetical protein